MENESFVISYIKIVCGSGSFKSLGYDSALNDSILKSVGADWLTTRILKSYAVDMYTESILKSVFGAAIQQIVPRLTFSKKVESPIDFLESFLYL